MTGPASLPVRDSLTARMAIMDRIDAMLRTREVEAKDDRERLRNALVAVYAHEGTPVPLALVDQAIEEHFQRPASSQTPNGVPAIPVPWARPTTRAQWLTQVQQAETQIQAAAKAEGQHRLWQWGLSLLGVALGAWGGGHLMQACYPSSAIAHGLGLVLVGPFALGLPLAAGLTAIFRWLNDARLAKRGVLRPDEAEALRDSLRPHPKQMAALQRWSTVPLNRQHLAGLHASRVPLLNLDAEQLEAVWSAQQATRLQQQRALRHARDHLRQRSETQETEAKWTHYMATLAAEQRRAGPAGDAAGETPVAQGA